jgi:hypothetical protein
MLDVLPMLGAVIEGLKTRRIGFSMWRFAKMIREFELAMRLRIWHWLENLRITCYNRKPH